LYVLERDFGITLPRWLQIAFSKVVQSEAERTGGEIEGAAIRKLFDAAYVTIPARYTLGDYALKRLGDRVEVRAVVSGNTIIGEGSGVVEALMQGIRRSRSLSATVEAFDEFALGSGTQASAMACVRLASSGETSIGVAFAEDTTAAALQAVLSALGRPGFRHASLSPAAAE
jgi:2-isopropylmalate synthase